MGSQNSSRWRLPNVVEGRVSVQLNTHQPWGGGAAGQRALALAGAAARGVCAALLDAALQKNHWALKDGSKGKGSEMSTGCLHCGGLIKGSPGKGARRALVRAWLTRGRCRCVAGGIGQVLVACRMSQQGRLLVTSKGRGVVRGCRQLP
jgi:hypothetical protein